MLLYKRANITSTTLLNKFSRNWGKHITKCSTQTSWKLSLHNYLEFIFKKYHDSYIVLNLRRLRSCKSIMIFAFMIWGTLPQGRQRWGAKHSSPSRKSGKKKQNWHESMTEQTNSFLWVFHALSRPCNLIPILERISIHYLLLFTF